MSKTRPVVENGQLVREQSVAARASLPPPRGEQISAEELQEFLEANQQLTTAQGIYNFVSGRLVRKYGLTPVDSFDTATGTITRGKAE